jgi:Ca2+:H+ antiporter
MNVLANEQQDSVKIEPGPPAGGMGLFRKTLWSSLLLTPVALAVHEFTAAGDVLVFALAAVALIPLAWLIGEATEQASNHTGAGVGGFLNASFGNAPELIIAVLAIRHGLPEIVRGSIAGSVVSNLLLVLGVTMIAGQGRVDRRSLLLQLSFVLGAVLLFLVPSVPGWNGDPDRHFLFTLTVPVAIVLIALYLGMSVYNLRKHRADAMSSPDTETGWSMRRALIALGGATVATALVCELLVGSLTSFGEALGLSDFFVAVVIVAIVGNAAEHGGAIVVARRGKTELASEIAVASSAQVAVFVAPVIALISVLFGPALPLSFRPIELIAMALAAIVVIVTVINGKSTRRGGFVLIAAYVLAAVAFGLAGDR